MAPLPGIQGIVDRVNTSLKGTDARLTGIAPTDRDFLHALFRGFPYAIALLMILTRILLTRAFRSIVLALKAVLLNLFSSPPRTASSCSSSSRGTGRRSGA